MFYKLQIFLILQSRCFTNGNLKNIAHNIDNKFKNIMVIVGAGLSTPSGIPDFRSPGSGLYSNLKKYNLERPQDMFDLSFFKKHPEPFYDLAQELYPGKYKPNLCHYFIYLLQEKGKLLRLYTQNIDGLERLAGIKEDLLVEAHGTFSTASCITCRTKYDPDEVRKNVFNRIVTYCKNCQRGIVKPDIVFFGESLSKSYKLYSEIDPNIAELLIIIGTSLEVFPFAWLPETINNTTPRLLINRDIVGLLGRRKNDVIIKGDIIEGTKLLAKEIGWYEELMDLVNRNNSPPTA